MFWARNAVLLAALLWSAAAAAANCQPNPNLNGPPFVDGCPLPASALNRGFAQIVQHGVLVASSTAALKAVQPTAAGQGAYRQGFATAGDGGAMTYVWGTAACTLNGGLGDDGAEIKPGAGSGCWRAVFTGPTLVQVWGGCLGGGDDSAAFQAMINAMQIAKLPARYSGNCAIHQTLQITAGLDFGATSMSDCLTTTANVDGFDIATDSPVDFHDFCHNYNVTPNGVANISLTGATPSSFNGTSRFRNIALQNGYRNFHTKNADYYVIDGVIAASIDTAVWIENPAVADAGDMTIVNSTFTGQTNSIGILWNSGGGLRFVNNKLIQFNHCMGFQLATGATTGVIFIHGNSMEGCVSDSVLLVRQGSTGGLGTVKIDNNEMTGIVGVSVPTDPHGVWLFDVTISNNTWIGAVNGGAYVRADTISNLNVSGGAVLNNVGTAKALDLGASSDGVVGGISKRGIFAASTFPGTVITMTCSSTCY